MRYIIMLVASGALALLLGYYITSGVAAAFEQSAARFEAVKEGQGR